MLILTRRVGETIIINDDIKIHFLDVKGRQTVVGIDAPKEIAVHREEIYRKIQNEKSNYKLDEDFDNDLGNRL